MKVLLVTSLLLTQVGFSASRGEPTMATRTINLCEVGADGHGFKDDDGGFSFKLTLKIPKNIQEQNQSTGKAFLSSSAIRKLNLEIESSFTIIRDNIDSWNLHSSTNEDAGVYISIDFVNGEYGKSYLNVHTKQYVNTFSLAPCSGIKNTNQDFKTSKEDRIATIINNLKSNQPKELPSLDPGYDLNETIYDSGTNNTTKSVD